MANYTITSGVVQSAQRIVIYGPEGIGKSSMLAQFPDPVFIDTEGSTKRLDVKRLPNPSSWTMLLDEVDSVIMLKPCKTLALDTADWAERLCVRYICDKAQKAGIEDFGYGKGYTYLAEEFGKLLNKLDEVIAAGIHVVIAAHAQIKKFEQPDELGAYDRWELKLSKQCAPMLKEWADAVLFANYKSIIVSDKNGKNKAQGNRRVMYTQHAATWDAKNRFGLPDMTDFDYKVLAPHIEGMSAPVQTVPSESVSTPQPGSIVGIEDKVPPLDIASLIPSTIPKALADLMIQYSVTPSMIQSAVAAKGWFPEDTPIENYGADFINGALIGGWTQMYKFIEQMGYLPF